VPLDVRARQADGHRTYGSRGLGLLEVEVEVVAHARAPERLQLLRVARDEAALLAEVADGPAQLGVGLVDGGLLRGHLLLDLAHLAAQVLEALLALALGHAQLLGRVRRLLELGRGDARALRDGLGLALDRGEGEVDLLVLRLARRRHLGHARLQGVDLLVGEVQQDGQDQREGDADAAGHQAEHVPRGGARRRFRFFVCEQRLHVTPLVAAPARPRGGPPATPTAW
jgi:hypothetical protein